MLKIVVVYDGISDLIRLDEIWSRLVEPLNDEIRIVSSAWNFALLRDPQSRDQATRHTDKADLIVLSASGKTPPPGYVRNWMNAWLPWKKGRRDTVVTVPEREPSRSAVAAPLRDYFRQRARQNGMDFFCAAGQ